LRVYADTSFLVSLYSPDVHSIRAAATIARLRATVFLTPLGELELLNALELRGFRKEASGSETRLVQARFQEHIASGFFSQQAMPATVYERARQISRRRTAALGLRTLDILHVASAILLKGDRFLTFAQRQEQLAKAEGLRLG
jgi:predicted nucleic acid-binding protein